MNLNQWLALTNFYTQTSPQKMEMLLARREALFRRQHQLLAQRDALAHQMHDLVERQTAHELQSRHTGAGSAGLRWRSKMVKCSYKGGDKPLLPIMA